MTINLKIVKVPMEKMKVAQKIQVSTLIQKAVGQILTQTGMRAKFLKIKNDDLGKER